MIKTLDEFYIQWHITERCNLRCPHCYQEEYNSKSELPLSDLHKIANQITIGLKKWKRKGRIALTGGEPFLKTELFPLMEYLEQDESVWRIGVLTNGVLIDENIIEGLLQIEWVKINPKMSNTPLF